MAPKPKSITTHCALGLVNPKSGRNAASALRAASCYGATHLYFTGERVEKDLRERGRWPREERMKGYREVIWGRNDRFLDLFDRSVTPVVVELVPGAVPLFDFQHPERAIYVFGPEDGSVPVAMRARCHHFVVIPTKHCLNLATAVTTILYDRAKKHHDLGFPSEIALPGDHATLEDDAVFLTPEAEL